MLTRAVFLISVVTIAGCSYFKSGSEKQALEEVTKAEAVLYGPDKNFKFDDKSARGVIASYEDFVKQYPDSKEAPEMLLKAADLYRALKGFDTALEIYGRIEKEYPGFDRMPQVIFLEGFVYENELYKLEKAKERYEFFLSKYPEHELADDVGFSLKNLGKSPEEIIRDFEKQAPPAQGTDTAAS